MTTYRCYAYKTIETDFDLLEEDIDEGETVRDAAERMARDLFNQGGYEVVDFGIEVLGTVEDS